MATIEEQIQAIEEEILRTQKNKATEFHIGKLKAKIARLKMEAEKRRAASSGGGQGYSVKKSGNATVGLVGFPSVGKSTLLNKLTDAHSEVGAYHFTTLDVVPGLMEYRGAKIQVLDMPGLIKGASRGKGRGREVISVARTCDLILLILDAFETHIEVLVSELAEAAIRLNQRPPDIVLTKTSKGGITVNKTVELTKIDDDMIKAMLQEYGIVNANVVIREDIDQDQFIDYLAGNRIYIPAIAVLNKIDLVNERYLNEMTRRLEGWRIVPISAEAEIGLDDLREAIFDELNFIRIYLKPQGREADMDEPMVIKGGSTVGTVCDTLHRDFRRKFRYAQVWGKSAKFPGQTVGLDHVMEDGDILTIVIKK